MLAQVDKEFWFAAPDITSDHGDKSIFFRISNLNETARVVIDMPANSSFVPIRFTLKPNDHQNVNLDKYLKLIEHTTAGKVVNQGIRIRSSAYISVYYELNNYYNTDIYSLKGNNALGYNFIIPSQNYYSNSNTYNPLPYNSFQIVATKDSTVVTITPKQNIVGANANTTIKILLNKGQSYSAKAENIDGKYHLGGSLVSANKPIAISVTDDSITDGKCSDVAGDQIVPIKSLGTEYIVISGELKIDELIYIYATEDSTEIYINGKKSPSIFNKYSEPLIVKNPLDICYIKSNKPVLVWHITGFGCEMGAAIIPPIDCTGSTEVPFFRTRYDIFILNILVQSGFEKDFILNDSTNYLNDTDFHVVPNTNGKWLYASKKFHYSIIPLNKTSIIKNTKTRFQVGLINGGTINGTKYGYFSSFSNLNLGSDRTLCNGDSIELDVGVGFDTITWKDKSCSQKITVKKEGTYWVRVAASNGCINQDTITISNTYKPIIDFVSDSIQCFNNHELQLKINPKVPSSSKISILYDDGTIGFDILQPKKYLKNGHYNLLIKLQNEDDCIDSFKKVYKVIPNPIADFSINNQLCENNPINFNSDVLNVGKPIAYKWDFSDGFKNNSSNPKHIFKSAGIYNVGLFAIDTINNCTDSFNKNIEIYKNPDLHIDLGLDSQCLDNNLYTLKLVDKNNTQLDSINWHSQADSIFNKNNHINYLISYSQLNRDSVSVFAINNNGCSDTASHQVNIIESPKVSIELDTSIQCFNNNKFIFRALYQGNSKLIKHQWTIENDNNIYYGDSLIYQFNAVGTFKVSLNSSILHCQVSDTISVSIKENPKASFVITDSIACLKTNYSSQFNKIKIYNNSPKYNYQNSFLKWSITDGTIYTNVDSIKHIFKNTGTYHIKQIISTKYCSDSISKKIVINRSPNAEFTINNKGQCLKNNSFILKKTGNTYDDTLFWNLGDGSKELNINQIQHSYINASKYIVSLIVKTKNGCSDSMNTKIETFHDPIANFTINNDSQCLNNNQFNLYANSSIKSGLINNFWRYSNQLKLSDSISININKPYKHCITLISVSDTGCADSIKKDVYIFENPSANFSLNKDSQCIKDNEFITLNKSQGKDITSYTWQLNDSIISTIANTNFTINKAGLYSFSLYIKDVNNCIDSASSNIKVFPMPQSYFSINDSGQCLDNNIFFTKNLSNISNGNLKYKWLFDDKKSNSKFEPTKTYKTAGEYTITLIATSDYNCIDSHSIKVKVFDLPSPDANYKLLNDSAQCLNDNDFELQNFSSNSTGNLNYIWRTSDGRIYTDSNLNISFHKADTFRLSLTATTTYGCKDSFHQDIWVQELPQIRWKKSSPICVDNNVNIINTSYSKSTSIDKYFLNLDNTIYPNKSNSFTFNSSTFKKFTIGATNAYSCTDSIIDSIYVNPNPQAIINYDYYFDNHIAFYSNSNSNSDYNMSFIMGDGNRFNNLASDDTILYQVKDSIRFHIFLSIVNDSGCAANSYEYIKIPKNYINIHAVSTFPNSLKNNMLLNWHSDSRATHYIIYRNKINQAYNYIASTIDTFLIDSNIDSKQQYKYKVIGIDKYGFTTDSIYYAQNIIINKLDNYNGESNSQKAIFTAYKNHWLDGVDHYEIYGIDSLGNMQYLTKSNDSEIITPYNSYQCFKIKAIEKEGNHAVSWSNTLCNYDAFYIPNSFSPNDDGINDLFAYWINGVDDFEIKIYNRWGSVIFASTNTNEYWDGTFNGLECPVDVYKWHIQFQANDGEKISKTGTVLLLR